MGAGFCPQKGVWLPLAASQTLCLPHLWVGKIVSTRLSASIRTVGRCGTVSSAFFRYPIASPYQWQTRGEPAVKPCRVGNYTALPGKRPHSGLQGQTAGELLVLLFSLYSVLVFDMPVFSPRTDSISESGFLLVVR